MKIVILVGYGRYDFKKIQDFFLNFLGSIILSACVGVN